MSFNARNSDPPTSQMAAEDLPHVDSAKVWAQFHEHRKLADFQLEAHLGGPMNGKWRKRRSDLVREKLLVDSGEMIVNPRSHKLVVVWMVAADYKPAQPAAAVQLVLL
jgi:hypothetical protein